MFLKPVYLTQSHYYWYLPKLHLHRSFLVCRPSKPPYTHMPAAPTAAEWLYRGLGPSPFHFSLTHFEVSAKKFKKKVLKVMSNWVFAKIVFTLS